MIAALIYTVGALCAVSMICTTAEKITALILKEKQNVAR